MCEKRVMLERSGRLDRYTTQDVVSQHVVEVACMSLQGFGRFSEPALLVLVSLLQGPKHGHAISDDVMAMTGKRPGPGTLYGAIGRLEATGLIRALPSDGRRKPYELTAQGRSEVTREVERLQRLTREGTRRLGSEIE
jgi:DNA-binding PadR family transcriptional regulator